MTDGPNPAEIRQTADHSSHVTQIGVAQNIYIYYGEDAQPRQPIPESLRPLVFISYASQDGKNYAQRLDYDLRERYGYRTWWDYKQLPGDKWGEAINRAIDDADAMIVVMTPATRTSTWVRREYQYALKRGKLVIPVQVRKDFGPYDAIADIAALQWVDVSDDYQAGMLALVARLPHLHLKKEPPHPRWFVLGEALLAVVALIVAVIAVSGGFGGAPTPPATTAAAFVPGATATPPPAALTPTETETPTATFTSTLSITEMEATIQAMMATEQARVAATEAAQATETERARTAVAQDTAIAQTATADAWTDTPTPDLYATMYTRLTLTAEAQTATATLWTATPTVTPSSTATPTFTSTNTPTDTPTSTNTPTNTSTPTLTPTPSETPAPTLSPRDEALTLARQGVTRNGDWTPHFETIGGIEMALVPAGCFQMGNDPEALGGGDADGGRQCFDEPFWIGRTEVTNAQYRQCVDARGCGDFEHYDDTDSQQPVVGVSWFNARQYAAWLTATTGVEWRLPTEAEWEYAARGPDGLFYPWGNEFVGDNLVYYGNSGGQTAAVGSRSPAGDSWVGAADLSGNVWEWVSSLYRDYPYDAADGREDEGDGGGNRVVRGGSWLSLQDGARAAYRSGSDPLGRNHFGGFRVVCDRPPST